MNRKEFLITVWRKGIQPILLMGIVFFCVKFLYHVFAASGTERFVTIWTLGFGLLILTMYLTGLLFKSLSERLKSLLPESIKLWIRVIGKMLNYIAPIVLGMIIYHFWKEDWITAALVFAVLLIQRIAELIKEERQATTT